eukprot:5534891-Pleurochrysis_carterae.AAC.2
MGGAVQAKRARAWRDGALLASSLAFASLSCCCSCATSRLLPRTASVPCLVSAWRSRERLSFSSVSRAT